MSQKNKLSTSSTKVWQRHALAKACALAMAGASVGGSAWAVPDPFGAALLTTYGGDLSPIAAMSGTYWSKGYNSLWLNSQTDSGSIMAETNDATYFSALTGTGGSYPVSITGNSILASAIANTGSYTSSTVPVLSLANSTDGILSLNLQIFTGLLNGDGSDYGLSSSASATLDNTSKADGTVYIKQSGLGSANLSLSNNTMGASVTLNSLDTNVVVATPSGYASTSKGSSTLSFGNTSNAMGDPSAPTAGSTGSVNLSNQQGVFNATGAAEVKSVMANVTVSDTAGVTPTLANSISANANSITANTTNNAAVSVFRSTAASSAFTGTVGVTNLQSTTITSGNDGTLMASVTGSGVSVDLRKGTGSTNVTGAVTVNDNKLSATALGNAAGAQSAAGSIAAGNAIIFEGGSNITGASTSSATDLAASIGSGTSNAEADLLINSVQRNSGNAFTSTLGTASITSNLDKLGGDGSLAQSGNTLSASAINNLAGNLISAGQAASIGSITASSVLLNTQKNNTVTTLAKVEDSAISATVGATDVTVDGAVTLSANTITATAQGNLASNTVALKADNLSVGSNGASNGVQLTPDISAAVSGLAVSALNVQINDAQNLSALNQGGSIAFSFSAAKDISGTQATVNNNQLTTVATANSASNRVTLQGTNASGLNAGLGNLQTNTDGKTEAGSGLSAGALGVSMEVGAVSASQLSLSSNSISAQAQLNSVNNSLSATSTTTSGALTGAPNAVAGDLSNDNVTAFADIALANAQLNTDTSADASTYGAMTVSTGALSAAATVQASGNRITALADGNAATNAVTLNSGSMSNMTAALVSGQRGSNADITTQAAGEVSVNTSTGAVTASSISVNDNTVKATSISNSSSNSLSVMATNATGAGLTITPTASSNLTSMTLVADMALLNNQKTDGSTVKATAGVDGTPALLKLAAGAVSSSANLTLNGNAVAASAYANSASNTGTVAINSMTGMTAALGNVQVISGGALEATTYGAVDTGLSSIGNSNVSVNTNAITSTAMANTVTNGLSITANNALGRGVQSSFTYSGDVIASDNVLTNLQDLANNTVVATTAGDVKLTSAGAVSGTSNVSLNSNTLSAYGSGNYATNDMTLAVNNMADATSALVSRQATDRTGMDSVKAITTGSVALQSGEVTSANLAMNGNAVKSTALDNVTSNQLTLTGTTATGKSTLSMTGLASPVAAPGSATVAADVSLINLQASTNDGNLKANTGVGSAIAITAEVAGANTGATVAANNNSISSLVYANNASNVLGMSVTTLTAMTGALSNTQQVVNGALDAATYGGISLTSTDAVSAASLTLKGNSMAATAGANEASNSLAVVTTDVVGRNVSSRITNAGSLAVATDFALGNEQQLASGTTVNAASTGDVHLNVSTNAVGTSKLALSDNSLSAYGSGNNASNQLSMVATNISQSSLGVASNQSMDAASAVTSAVNGSIKMTAGDATNSNLSATGNTIKSTALGNVVGNTLTATASTYTGPNSLEGSVEFLAGSAATKSSSDWAIANVQKNTSTAGISATTTGTVQMALGAVDLAEGGVSASGSLTGNTLKALAQSNSASNEIKLNITEFTGATAGVVSYQNSTAAVSASLAPAGSGLFAITTGDVTGGSISVSGNTASALAGINEAFNTLTVTGANLLGRPGSITEPVVGVATSTGADFAVMNAQSASTSAAATVDVGTSGFSTSGSFTGGNVGVTGNAVLARASANTANNALTLAATNRLEASGVVNNVQDMVDATTVKATVNAASAIGAEFGSVAGNAVVTVQDNTVTAQATGNVANNALNATATNGIAAAGSSATSPTFAVLNSQSTGTSVTGIQSAINGITVGGAQVGGALNGGSFNASANQLLSMAYGNSANNAVVVSALAPGLNTASASITSVQYNLASVTASVSNTNVQVSGSMGATGGSVNINGNSTIAMAVGNRSVNSITGR